MMTTVASDQRYHREGMVAAGGTLIARYGYSSCHPGKISFTLALTTPRPIDLASTTKDDGHGGTDITFVPSAGGASGDLRIDGSLLPVRLC